ncbi:hypothetical protein RUM43_012801 [Polyplax serrata]|uniref:Carrier domain-containing protein n=1 Tax=Polyplax serrata TaxID=468196 RepID=A0AAN8S9Q5_POLSC
MTSILKGPKAQLSSGIEPITIHRVFENTVDVVEKIFQNNNNEVKIIHSINIKESEAQQTALTTEENTLSYAELNESANKLARAIIKALPKDASSGNIDGDILIAVCMRPSEVLVVTLLAIWKVGAAYLPLDVEFPETRIQHILTESKPVMTIVDDFDMGSNFNVTKISELRETGMDMPGYNLQENETLQLNVPKKDLLAAVLYTSGSTGVPKGVRIPHSAILNRLKWQFRTFPYAATEKVCAFKTALTFVDSICELWGPLLNGRTILIIAKEETKNPERLTALLEKFEVERLVLVPTLLQAIIMYGSIKKSKNYLKHLRLWVCSGETLSISLAKKFFECFDNKTQFLCNFYGSTEVMGDVTYHVIRSREELEHEHVIPIGKPVDNCNIYVLDKHLRPVPTNEMGELYVSGLNLASGYVRGRDPDKFLPNSVEADIGHLKLYKTGDFARIYENTVYYEGRRDFQIKVRGHRVDLSEIESALAKVKEVDRYVVLTYNAGETDQAVLAYVTVKGELTGAEIEKHLATVLASYMLPQVLVVDHFPLLVNGKVDRQYFLKKYKDEFASVRDVTIDESKAIDYTDVEERNLGKAKVLFETILNVLGKSLRCPIEGKSNFYHLGGNSLNSIFTVTKLQDFGYSISISDFISSPTLLDVLDKMVDNDTEKAKIKSKFVNGNYKMEFLTEKHKQDVFEVITSSFYEKADLERHLVPPVKLEDYIELMENLWPHLLEKSLSFVATDAEGNVKGAALNFDAFDEPEVTISPDNKLNIIFEFLEFLEGPIRETKLPQGKNKVLHSFMMGSRTNLCPQVTIEVFFYMEEQVLNMARTKGFQGIFTSNTNALTQQLGCDVNNYEALLDYQVNQFVAENGTKPFASAPDSQRTIVSWKKI